MTTNREVLDFNEKCGKPFGMSLFDCVCGRPAGHRPAKLHALSPTASDLRRSLRQTAVPDADADLASSPYRPDPATSLSSTAGLQ